MSNTTPRLALPELVAAQSQKHVTHNEALVQLDAFVDLYLLGLFVDTPPSSPNDGDAYVVGAVPTGAWSGYAFKIASCLDGAWNFYTPFNGLRGYNNADGKFYVYVSGTWTDWNSLISAGEVSVASAATCDLGAAGSLFVAITGTTSIASFGTATNRLRFVRFAGALTLTYNATSLILLGGASRVTAAGDVGIYASDASGNWRERAYHRAASDTGDLATKSGTETLTNKTISGAANTLSNIPNAALANASVTLNGHALSLGGSLSLSCADVSALALSGGTLTGALQAPNIGVNTTPDSTNKLSVASSAILFSNIGTDCRIYLNKGASANTASTLYEDNFSGRAEVGLCGDDNFHFKTSPDGSTWTEAFTLAPQSGGGAFIGINNTQPAAPMELHSNGTTPTNSALISSDDFVISKESSSASFTGIVANGAASTNRMVFKGTRAHGTLNSPAACASGDYTFSLLGAPFDGTSTHATAAIDFVVDGAVSTGVTPQRIVFETGTTTSRSERARFNSTGEFGIGKTATAGVLLDVGGTIAAKTYTVATLPAASAIAGQKAYVSDSTQTHAAGLGTAATGGGANFVPVYSNGTNWIVG